MAHDFGPGIVYAPELVSAKLEPVSHQDPVTGEHILDAVRLFEALIYDPSNASLSTEPGHIVMKTRKGDSAIIVNLRGQEGLHVTYPTRDEAGTILWDDGCAAAAINSVIQRRAYIES